MTKAPIGYRNVGVRDEVGREARTVEIDEERAAVVRWAYQGVTCAGAHEAIVPNEVWDQVQTVLGTHRSAAGATAPGRRC